MFNNLFLKSPKTKNDRTIHWLEWVKKLLTRKGIDIDIDSCAYGKTHLVSRAKPIGGGWLFYSQGCSGCAHSRIGLEAIGGKLPKGAPNCAMLSGPLLSLTKVQNGTKFLLPLTRKEDKVKPKIFKLAQLSAKPIGTSELQNYINSLNQPLIDPPNAEAIVEQTKKFVQQVKADWANIQIKWTQ